MGKNNGICLLGMVKDEMVNPAGGIEDYIHSHLPYVDRAVIVDTCSTDGTWEMLNGLRKDYPHLSVHSRPFDGYASTRNYNFSMAQKLGYEWLLTLDGDERLTPEGFQKLRDRKGSATSDISHLYFGFTNIHPDGSTGSTPILNQRLVRNGEFHFEGKGLEAEFLTHVEKGYNLGICMNANTDIIHFLPSEKQRNDKDKWYSLKRAGEFLTKERHLSWKSFSSKSVRLGFPGLRKLSKKELRRLGVLDTTTNSYNPY